MPVLKIKKTDGTWQEVWGAPGNGSGGDGVGIASVRQTTTSSEDDGNNVITVTLTNGVTSTFIVQNGSKGSKGDSGYSPIRGTDYWTDADKAEIKSYIDNNIPTTSGATEGAFLRNIGGIPTWSSVTNGEEVSY